MNEQARHLALEALANGERPDWSALFGTEQVPADLRRLGEIMAAFRQNTADPESTARPMLFAWRHLHVIEKIGEGSFGVVYRAYDPVLRRDVALKLARLDAAHVDPRAIVSEARRLARLRHPNILAVHGADQDQDSVGIWCDLLGGVTLQHVLDRSGTLPARAVLDLATPLCDALALVHARGFTHGDLKPANIMLEDDGTPVLMDFGAARDPMQTGSTVGSPLLMAPEQFDGVWSAASDLYAFGAMLFRCLSGRFPRVAADMAELERQHRRRAQIDFEPIPLRWRALLRQLLAHDPGARPSAEETRARLARMASARKRVVRRITVAGVVIALTAGMLAGWWAYLSAERSRQRTELVKNIVVEAVEGTLPSGRSGPSSVKSMYENLGSLSESRLGEFPDALAEMQLVVGYGLAELGDAEHGLEVAERGMRLLLDQRADAPLQIGKGWLQLGSTRALAARNAEAEDAVRRALASLDQVDAVDEAVRRVRLEARNELAILLGYQGKWVAEVAAQRELLQARIDAYGPDSEEVAVDHHNLSMAYTQIGDFDAAIEHSRRAVDLVSRHGGESSIRMGYAQFGLAMAELERGDFDQARASLSHARELYAANLPEGHRSFASLDILEARLWLREGRHDAAIERLRAVSARGDLGSERQLNARRYLAEALLRASRWDAARTATADVLASLTERQQPLRPFLEAAVAWCDYRGNGAPAPTEVLHRALENLQAQGLERMPIHALLQDWQHGLDGT